MAYGHLNVPGVSGYDMEQLKTLINSKALGTDITRLEELINGKESGKRFARFVVGTSTAGWTAEDCDYLCDGTEDNVEIQAAIDALPATGGTVVILDGDYNISTCVYIKKNNVTLTGQGCKLYAGESCNTMISLAEYYEHHTVSNLKLYCKGHASGICSRGKESKIFGNHIYDAFKGIDGSNNAMIINNHIGRTNEFKDVYQWNGYGIYSYGGTMIIGNIVEGPVAENPENYSRAIGIRTSQGVCIGNYVTRSSTGIEILGTALVTNNRIMSCTVGVIVAGASFWKSSILMGNYIKLTSNVNSPKYSILLEKSANNNSVIFNFYSKEYPITDESSSDCENWVANNWEIVE